MSDRASGIATLRGPHGSARGRFLTGRDHHGVGADLLVLGALFELARPAASLNRSLPETANVQQRLRHAFDRLHTDLLGAGRGTGLVSPGPLGRFLPPVVPYRLGLRAAEGEHRRVLPSAITIPVRVSDVGLRDHDSEPDRGTHAGCASRAGSWVCAASLWVPRSDLVLVFDERGAWDLFRVRGTGAMTLALERAHATATVFAPGAVLAPIDLHHYYGDAERMQLRHYNGWQGDFPLVDDLVDLRFRFFGDAGALVCQGPAPAAAGGSRIEISLAELRDGPWCGPAGLPFDADLLRIRAVAVDLRVQSAVAELRGADPRFFARPGPAPGVRGLVPDYAISFTVAPRNLSYP